MNENSNYLLQNLMENCSDKDFLQFAEAIFKDFVLFTTSFYSSKVAQLFIIRIKNKPDLWLKFSRLLLSNLIQISSNRIGMNTVKIFIEMASSENITAILEAFSENIMSLKINNYSCFLLNFLLKRQIQVSIKELYADSLKNYLC